MSTTELEALVGHLFVISGRSISAASPGAIAMPAPRRAARGRDSDTFFGLIGLGQGQRESAATYEEAIRGVAGSYFNTGGSVTSALRDALNVLNSSLKQRNNSRENFLSVGLACAILREQELYLAVIGPARAFLIREDFVERLPDDEEVEEGMPALGTDSEPDVRFYRREIRPGDFLILADSSLNHLKNIAIRHAVESGEVDASVINLRSVSGDFAAAEVIKFVTPLGEGEIDPIPPSRRLPMVPPVSDIAGTARDAVQAMAPVASAVLPAGDREISSAPNSTGTAGSSHQAETYEPGRRRALPFFRRFSRDAALTGAQAADRTRTLVEKMMPAEEVDNPLSQRLQLSTTMQVGVAFAVAVIVALVTIAVYRFRGATSQYAQLVREAQKEIDQARAAGNNQAGARPHWENAISLFDQAAEIRSPSVEIWSTRTEALQVLDSYDHVTRVTPVLLREYEPGVYLQALVVQGINIYTIDTTSDILYREDLNEKGTALVNRDPQIITRRGEVIDNQVIGGMIDLIWMIEGGVPQRNVLSVLSQDASGNGLLITYSPSFNAAAVILPSSQAMVEPRAIAVYNRDLYILDSGANEIWRYPAGPNGYNTQPQRYFTDVDPQLADAIDMEIDSNGNIYVLHASGKITKYFFGKPEAFDFEGLPQPITHPTSLFLNLSPFDRSFFIAVPGGGQIYSTTLTGDFLQNYKGADDTILKSVSGVVSLDQPPHVYLSAGNRLYYFPRP